MAICGASNCRVRIPHPFQWGFPTVNVGEALLMMAATFTAFVESTGTFEAAARYGGATPPPFYVHNRGAGCLGISILLDGFFGTVSGSAVLAENVGLLGLTRVGSRWVVQISAWLMLFFSVFGKFGAVLASIPLPIFGALYCFLDGYMPSAGFDFLQWCNLNTFRVKSILGTSSLSILALLSMTRYSNGRTVTSCGIPITSGGNWFKKLTQVTLTSPATIAVGSAVFLDYTIRKDRTDRLEVAPPLAVEVTPPEEVPLEHPETAEFRFYPVIIDDDSGRHWWKKFRETDGDARNAEFYSLPLWVGSVYRWLRLE
ncbi:hypothetical protein NMG60_11019794 [Bertholletia excelsa]